MRAAGWTGLPGNAVTLSSGAIPAGAIHTPALPLLDAGPNATATTVFNWTPTNAQVGLHTIVYTAVDQLNQTVTCTVQINVAECFLLLGFTEGSLPLGPEVDDRLLVLPLVIYPVTQTQIPTLFIPNDAGLMGLNIAAQVGMLNAQVYPLNPLQMSNGWRLTLGTGTQAFGMTTGVNLSGDPVPSLGANYHFAFTIL